MPSYEGWWYALNKCTYYKSRCSQIFLDDKSNYFTSASPYCEYTKQVQASICLSDFCPAPHSIHSRVGWSHQRLPFAFTQPCSVLRLLPRQFRGRFWAFERRSGNECQYCLLCHSGKGTANFCCRWSQQIGCSLIVSRGMVCCSVCLFYAHFTSLQLPWSMTCFLFAVYKHHMCSLTRSRQGNICRLFSRLFDKCPLVSFLHANLVNPFTPKSYHSQMSPAASPEILHHTVWRTWFLIAYSNERRLYYQFALPHLYIFSLKVGRMYFLRLGVEGF